MRNVILSHPTGNANVRQVLQALVESGRLCQFFTGAGWSRTNFDRLPIPTRLRKKLSRRVYDIPSASIRSHLLRDGLRLLGVNVPGFSDIDSVYQALDHSVANALQNTQGVAAVYCYEDGALETFRRAKQLGIRCIYDLPIAYWETSRQLLAEEQERLPEWAPTLQVDTDSKEKSARKAEEISLADAIVCPSDFVRDSIPEEIRRTKAVHVTPFGSPLAAPTKQVRDWQQRKLRVLFVGSMTQRKGLADLFEAIKLLPSEKFELHILGSPLQPLSFYRQFGVDFVHHEPRPHAEVLELMDQCHVFVLPSLVEGRALVQQEALSRGLPIIVTHNAGASDLVEDGEAGVLVPIRSPESIAQALSRLEENRDQLKAMSRSTIERAHMQSWEMYRRQVSELVGNT